MNQLTLTLCAILLAGCSAPQPAPFVFPQSVGEWKLKAATDLAAANAPEPLRRLGVKRAQSADYEGPGRITAQVYEMAAQAAAFEGEQQWKPAPDTVAFHRDQYFFVIHWEGASREAVGVFVREMQKPAAR